MLRWMIASDIHGSAAWCRHLVETFEAEGADRLLLLGDMLYNDAAPHERDETAALLNGLAGRITAVRGNCDRLSDLEMLDFDVEPETVCLPIGKAFMTATHGHLYNETRLPPRLEKGDVLMLGHTHVPRTAPHGTYLYLNPGSVGLPRYGSPHSCMTLADGLFRWLDLSDGKEYRRYQL